MRSFLLALTLLFATASAASAEMHHPLYTHSPNEKHESPSSAGFEQAMQKMHEDMMIDYSGDTDADFVRGMIPHHQGAIDMAKIELTYGKDPKLKALARSIIKAQESEIKTMKRWLAAHDKDSHGDHAPH